MNVFTLRSHIEDLALYVEANSLKSLFVTALEGMNKMLKKDVNTHKSLYQAKERIELVAEDKTDLLIKFLSEVLIRSQIRRALFTKVIFREFSENSLTAVIYGSNIRRFDNDIKSVTHHEARIEENPKGNYEAVVVFDI